MVKKSRQKTAQIAREITANDLADELDIHRQTVVDYDREGAPREKRGRAFFYNAGEYLAWMRTNGKTGKQGRPIEGDSPDLEAARLRKENALASKYELQVARERVQLLPIEHVKQLGASAISTFRNRILGGASILTVRLEGRDAAERQAIIESFHNEVLNHLASDLEKLGVGHSPA